MFDDRLTADYLRRAYFAVDGLWFMKAEERLGFREALDLDQQVWQVLAKIQARKARDLLDTAGSGVPDLAAALELKFAAEEYTFRTRHDTAARVEFEITKCPWLKLLRRSERTHLADAVGSAICPTEYRTWAEEFGAAISASLSERMCAGDNVCRLLLESPRSTEASHRS